jgi:hypothetical protein
MHFHIYIRNLVCFISDFTRNYFNNLYYNGLYKFRSYYSISVNFVISISVNVFEYLGIGQENIIIFSISTGLNIIRDS